MTRFRELLAVMTEFLLNPSVCPEVDGYFLNFFLR
jgi:hypothetical protein